MPSDTEMLEIHVGPLSGVDSLCMNAGQSLDHFNDLYQKGASPEVVWDLSQLRRGAVNLGSLTAFLALAYRMRQFTLHAPRARLSDDPEVLAFLSHISFLDIARRYDLWQSEAVCGVPWVSRGLNPHTKLFIFDLPKIPNTSDKQYFNTWKDWVRSEVKKAFLLRCGPLFVTRRGGAELPEEIEDELAITCAELVLNSVIHGRSPAFIGLQRTTPRITVAVADCGRGFQRALQDQHLQEAIDSDASAISLPLVRDDLQALLLGSLVNTQGYGVRRANTVVVGTGGWIDMSSGSAQIRWRAALWDETVRRVGDDFKRVLQAEVVLGSCVDGPPSLTERARGFYRVHPFALRGTRISFEIPLNG